jgi:heme/copper-type cytochrome/quinol oxidase subunit 2
MKGRIVVHSRKDFDAWVKQAAEKQQATQAEQTATAEK